MYCTTERDPATCHLRWRELKVAAVYEGKPSRLAPAPERPENALIGQPSPLPAQVRVACWLRELDPEGVIAAPDQAQQVTYVAQTGPWEQFGSRLWLELWERGLGRVRSELVVVADGSDHLDQVVNRELRLPGIHLTRILDLAHARASPVGREPCRLWRGQHSGQTMGASTADGAGTGAAIRRVGCHLLKGGKSRYRRLRRKPAKRWLILSSGGSKWTILVL